MNTIQISAQGPDPSVQAVSVHTSLLEELAAIGDRLASGDVGAQRDRHAGWSPARTIGMVGRIEHLSPPHLRPQKSP